MRDNGIVYFIDKPTEVEVINNNVYVRDNIHVVESEMYYSVDKQYAAHEIQYSLSEWALKQVNAITPYTETKTAYIGDTDITFYDTPAGNLTVYFPHEYTVERLSDRIIISFEELEEVTDVTISII